MATVGVVEAIARRRSIRNFKDTPIPRESIEKLLAAAVLAPSAKNRQPWRFVVLQGAARTKLARLMVEGADYVESRGDKSGSCRNSARIVAQAPVTILVFNAAYEHEGIIFDHVTYNAPDIQSIGGMVQTMLLAAEELGLAGDHRMEGDRAAGAGAPTVIQTRLARRTLARLIGQKQE